MSDDALQSLRALLDLLNRPNVNREVNRLFRSVSSASGSSTTAPSSTAASVAVSATAPATSTAQSAGTLRNIGPIFNTSRVRGRGRGRPRGSSRQHPYAATTSAGYSFSRLVILLPDPAIDEVPRGRRRQYLRESNLETHVNFRTTMTSQEIRTNILQAFQTQGHLRNIT